MAEVRERTKKKITFPDSDPSSQNAELATFIGRKGYKIVKIIREQRDGSDYWVLYVPV